MGDARRPGGRQGRSGWSGGTGQRPQRDYSERWLDRALRGLYGSVVDEPVPDSLLGVVGRLPEQPSAAQALDRARRWRAKAEEIETAADSMHDHSARQALLQLARSYRTLAQYDEELVQQLAARCQASG